MSTVCTKNFQHPILDVPEDAVIDHPPMLLFGDFINSAVPKENRVYAEIPDMAKLMIVLKVKSLLLLPCYLSLLYRVPLYCRIIVLYMSAI